MNKSRVNELTPRQRKKIDEELEYLQQAGVGSAFEQYVAVNEFTSADFAGGLGALSGLLGGASILLAVWLSGELATGIRIYLAVVAITITAIPFWAMRKNNSKDAPRRAAALICQLRAASPAPGQEVPELTQRAVTTRVLAGILAAASAAGYLLGAGRKSR